MTIELFLPVRLLAASSGFNDNFNGVATTVGSWRGLPISPLPALLGAMSGVGVPENFYGIGGIGFASICALVVVELILIAPFAAGLFKTLSYGAVLLRHAAPPRGYRFTSTCIRLRREPAVLRGVVDAERMPGAAPAAQRGPAGQSRLAPQERSPGNSIARALTLAGNGQASSYQRRQHKCLATHPRDPSA